jgi:hypothetical protein
MQEKEQYKYEIVDLYIKLTVNEKIIMMACEKFNIQPLFIDDEPRFSKEQFDLICDVMPKFYDGIILGIKTVGGISKLVGVSYNAVSIKIRRLGIEPIEKQGKRLIFAFDDVKTVIKSCMYMKAAPRDYYKITCLAKELGCSSSSVHLLVKNNITSLRYVVVKGVRHYNKHDAKGFMGNEFVSSGEYIPASDIASQFKISSSYVRQIAKNKNIKYIIFKNIMYFNKKQVIKHFTKKKTKPKPTALNLTFTVNKSIKEKCNLLGIDMATYFDKKDSGQLVPMLREKGFLV